ncbi:pilus assembly FimT family protein [Aquabacterium sp. OR-4]|uniref:pilus assembly FimT family protein n=1 Tax=Aquabacterium sp. OR-4 TaxID=2978127 RepID=UPI0021B1FD11|nr:prepilin-type N-terminal cleavage/methylation domain-containing protein [Aquabacterium sp. OR-4]MDT7836574.1 prepilin-type N-terminal cleavage/methylation domain-containing protein [Aquabacterium sp. OR-4]
MRAPAQRAGAAPGGARPARAGFTLVELAIVLVVLALLLVAGVPSLGAALARHRLQATARALQADVALARQLAVARGLVAHITLQPGPHWCWALSLDTPVDCRVARQGGPVIKVVHAEAHPNITLDEAAAMALDGRSGTRLSPPGQSLFVSRHGDRLSLRLNTLGRANLCTTAGALPGVQACSDPGG